MKKNVRTFLKNDEWKYLFIKHKEKWSWTLPWWHVDVWENVYDALKREIKEELNLEIKIVWNKLGLDIKNLKEKPLPICIYKIKYKNKNKEEKKKLEYIFLSEIKSGVLKLQIEEIYDYKYFSKEEILKEKKIYKQVKQIIEHI